MADMTLKTRHTGNLKDLDEYKGTGSGALAQVLNIGKSFEIVEIRLHLGSAATQEDFEVSIDSHDGSAYDVNLLSVDMSEDADGVAGVVTDVVWRPDNPVLINRDDKVNITWTNTDAATWGLKALVRADVRR